MVKFLSCADCGKIFRGERRTPCSERILELLRRKVRDSTASDLDFVHVSCCARLWREYCQPNADKQHVRRFPIYGEADATHVHMEIHSHSPSTLLLLVFFFL